MNVCPMPGCQTTAGCVCSRTYQPFTIPPRHSMPVNLPVPRYGMVTIAVMDSDGGVTIRVDQARPENVVSR